MDDRSHCDLIGPLAPSSSRRGVLTATLSGLLGGLVVLPDDVDGAKRRRKHAKKRRDRGKTRPSRGKDQDNIQAAAGEKRPFPQHVTYANDTILPNHRTQAQLDDDVRAAYDRWKKNYVVGGGAKAAPRKKKKPKPPTLPDGQFRIAFGKPGTKEYNETVSEGQGYGMLAVALMAGHDPEAQTIFDGLWRFARAHPSDIDNRLMDYDVPGNQDGNDSAFDGDCDMAYALLLADAQWGSGGSINYRAEFDRTIAAIVESTIGPNSHLPLLGDWAKGIPDNEKYNQFSTRTSDFMPGHFRAFRRATGNDLWNEVIAACQQTVDALQANNSPQTGLLPDFVQPVSAADHTPRPADPNFLEGPDDGEYDYNAGRDPWRLGTDVLLNGDNASKAAVTKISNWAAQTTGGDPQKLRAGYKLNGTVQGDADYFTTFFAAPLAVAAMTVPGQQQWLNALYDAVSNVSEDYFEDSVTLLCLLVLTRNFWDPSG